MSFSIVDSINSNAALKFRAALNVWSETTQQDIHISHMHPRFNLARLNLEGLFAFC